MPSAMDTPSIFNLTGKIALVPGGSGGIGSAVANLLAECGADIAIGYGRNVQSAKAIAADIESLGRRVRISQVDASDPESVALWVRDTEKSLGPIDILANCVGSDGGFKLFREQSLDELRRLADQHFWAPIHLARALLDGMIERKSGRIINLSSDGAKVGQSGAAVANGGNAAAIAFGKSLAREVARYGITVNAVCPGPTRTNSLVAMLAQKETGAKLANALTRVVPMKRLGEPREVAAAFAFLASEAGQFITGQALSVSGGLTMC